MYIWAIKMVKLNIRFLFKLKIGSMMFLDTIFDSFSIYKTHRTPEFKLDGFRSSKFEL